MEEEKAPRVMATRSARPSIGEHTEALVKYLSNKGKTESYNAQALLTGN